MSRSSVPAIQRLSLPALPAHVDTPLILEHPSVRPLILEITDEEFRTGHLDVPPPPRVPRFEDDVAPVKPRRRRPVIAIAASAIALVLIAIVPAVFADRARASREPAAALAVPALSPVIVVTPTQPPPVVASSSVAPTASVVKAVTVKPIASASASARAPAPALAPASAPASAPAPAPASAPADEAPFGVGDPGF